jgi:hypothetical protein
MFSCEIFNEYKNNENNEFIGTEMRGHVYKTTSKETYVSFGGLLCKIPKVVEYHNKNLIMRYTII